MRETTHSHRAQYTGILNLLVLYKYFIYFIIFTIFSNTSLCVVLHYTTNSPCIITRVTVVSQGVNVNLSGFFCCVMFARQLGSLQTPFCSGNTAQYRMLNIASEITTYRGTSKPIIPIIPIFKKMSYNVL